MPLPEHRVLEHNRNQDNGEPSAQPIGVELPPAIRADLLDPAIWQDGLAKYARATNLAVALADAAGRLIGATINPRPTWSLLHAKTPPISPPSEGAAGGVGCPFSLAPLKPCNCVADALARGGFVVARDRTGLVHFAVPLVLGEHPLGRWSRAKCLTSTPNNCRWSKWPGSSVSHRHRPGRWLAWNILSSGPPWKCMPTCWRPWARRSSRRAITRSWQQKDEGRNARRKPTRAAPGSSNRSCRHGKRSSAGLRGTSTTASANPSRRCSLGCVRRQRCLRLRKRDAAGGTPRHHRLAPG